MGPLRTVKRHLSILQSVASLYPETFVKTFYFHLLYVCMTPYLLICVHLLFAIGGVSSETAKCLIGAWVQGY